MMNDPSPRAAWGVDGCKAGWFFFRLPVAPHSDSITWGVVKTLGELMESPSISDRDLVLVDIPIALVKGKRNADVNERECDVLARNALRYSTSANAPSTTIGDRSKSVFTTPVHDTLGVFESDLDPVGTKEEKAGQRKKQFNDVRQRNMNATGGQSVSAQAFGILRKIAEVHQLRQTNDTARHIVRETHPEVCFSALNGKPMDFKKKHGLGFRDRVHLLDDHFSGSASRAIDDASRWCSAHRGSDGSGGSCCRKIHGVAGDDLVDAMVCAVTAWLILNDPTRARALPSRGDVAEQPDPPEIVYAVPPRTLPGDSGLGLE